MRLGQELRDKVSGIKGIAVSRTEFINGCVRFAIQAPMNKKDNTLPPEVWFDEKQLEVVGKGIKMDAAPTGGPTSLRTPKGARA